MWLSSTLIVNLNVWPATNQHTTNHVIKIWLYVRLCVQVWHVTSPASGVLPVKSVGKRLWIAGESVGTICQKARWRGRRKWWCGKAESSNYRVLILLLPRPQLPRPDQHRDIDLRTNAVELQLTACSLPIHVSFHNPPHPTISLEAKPAHLGSSIGISSFYPWSWRCWCTLDSDLRWGGQMTLYPRIFHPKGCTVGGRSPWCIQPGSSISHLAPWQCQMIFKIKELEQGEIYSRPLRGHIRHARDYGDFCRFQSLRYVEA